MNTAIFCFVAFLALFAEQSYAFRLNNLQDVAAVHKTCVEKIKPSPELAEKFKRHEYPANEKTNCFVHCLMHEMEMFDDKVGFLDDKIVAQMSGANQEFAATTKENIAKCRAANPPGEQDVCSWVAKNFFCFIDANKAAIQGTFGQPAGTAAPAAPAAHTAPAAPATTAAPAAQ